MKITEETKIKDFMPNGTEIESYSFSDSHVTVMFKEKQKDFGRYSIEYLAKLIALIHSDTEELMEKSPVHWRWEFRIGLFKYICEDLGYDWMHLLSTMASGAQFSKVYPKIVDICPEEFLKSLV